MNFDEDSIKNLAGIVRNYRHLNGIGGEIITRKDHKIAKKYLQLAEKDEDLWILDFLKVEFNKHG